MTSDDDGRSKPAAKRPRRAAYALPTLFTSGNIFLGFVAIQAFQGALQAQSGDLGPNSHFELAAKTLGFAVFFDGLDGMIARVTNTVSDFGREMDSLADVITFGLAPAVLAFVWGVLFVTPRATEMQTISHLTRAGYLIAFFYLLCGAVRLARFNVQTNPVPKNPGRPGRKYFVGMPIPAGAGFIAAVVFMDTAPVRQMSLSVPWLAAMGVISVLMVSSWRYPSFKQISFSKPHTTVSILIVGLGAFLIWAWPQPVLLVMAIVYVSSGIITRIGGLVRRYRRHRPAAPLPEHQVG